jgi:hypothetical protein
MLGTPLCSLSILDSEICEAGLVSFSFVVRKTFESCDTQMLYSGVRQENFKPKMGAASVIDLEKGLPVA